MAPAVSVPVLSVQTTVVAPSASTEASRRTFIRCESIKLPYQAIVEMSFALESAGKQTIYQMQAMVLHHARNGYGLMFKDFKLEAFRALKDLLYAA